MAICELLSATWEAAVSKGLLAIDAGAVLTPLIKFAPGRVIIDGPSIVDVGAASAITVPSGAELVDASQMLVTPGFIEPHIHGGGGADVMDGTYESLNLVSRILPRHGTTSFLATTVSSPSDVLTSAIEKIGKQAGQLFDGAQLLGIHLEGPFISPAKRGTHKAAYVAAPDTDLFRKWIHAANKTIRLVTLAPELPGTHELLRIAKDSGIFVAMGHSNATSDEAHSAIEEGVCYAVHTFNAMRAFSHRDPGIVGEVLSDDRVFAEIIADGIHVDPSVIRLFARAKGHARFLLVTDAISAMDMRDGRYILGNDTVDVVGGVCRDSEGHLAGSTLTQEVALRNFVEWSGWRFEDALLGLTLNPARALNLDKKGMLEPGADADVVLLDHTFRVMKTFVKGRLVFDRLWTN
jgi:N-acetylglucosamine-6-phosphate deacetylase